MKTLALSLMALSLAACTATRNSRVDAPRVPQVQGPAQGGDLTGSLPIVLDEAKLKSYNVNTANLSYKFEYLDARRADALVFQNGTARLTFSNLQNGRKGDLKLDIYEGSEHRFAGVIKDLELRPGLNQAQLQLKPVGSTGAAGDLTIDVSIDVPNGGNPPGPSNPLPPSPQPPTPGNPPGGGNQGLSAEVKKIFDQHCVECHHAGKQIDLTKFPMSAGDQSLLGTTLLSVVGTTMPPAPRDKLTPAQIDTLRKWKDAGFKP